MGASLAAKQLCLLENRSLRGDRIIISSSVVCSAGYNLHELSSSSDADCSRPVHEEAPSRQSSVAGMDAFVHVSRVLLALLSNTRRLHASYGKYAQHLLVGVGMNCANADGVRRALQCFDGGLQLGKDRGPCITIEIYIELENCTSMMLTSYSSRKEMLSSKGLDDWVQNEAMALMKDGGFLSRTPYVALSYPKKDGSCIATGSKSKNNRFPFQRRDHKHIHFQTFCTSKEWRNFEGYILPLLFLFILIIANALSNRNKSPPTYFVATFQEDLLISHPLDLLIGCVHRTTVPCQALSGPGLSATSYVAFQSLKFLEPIGSGSFKTVYHGLWGATNVAIACMQNGGILPEARLLQHVSPHPHLITFYRWSADVYGNEYVVMELLPTGPLDKVLRKRAEELSMRKRVAMCGQICQAMQHLVSHGIVHRDLAARNVLVQSLHPVHVKVADLGFAKSSGAGASMRNNSTIHSCSSDVVAVRWIPPEVIKEQLWSEKSDIWAFGITMWEIFSNGTEPYTSLFQSDREVAQYVVQGGLLKKPIRCPDFIYHLMLQCWNYKAEARPSFDNLCKQFEQIEDNHYFIQHDLESSKRVKDTHGLNLYPKSFETSTKNLYTGIDDLS